MRKQAYERALASARSRRTSEAGPKELDIPAIEGIGGLQIYLVDRYGAKGSIYDVDFEWIGGRDPHPRGAGLHYLDHLTHNVRRGRMTEWAGFYEKLFNFREIRYFDIAGKITGLHSRAMTSPDGKIRIPINEDAGETGQIEEYLQEYSGEGIQHVALGSTDLYATIESARGERRRLHAGAERHLLFAHRPAAAEARRAARPPEANGILIDGEGVVEGGYTKVLLQRFSKTVIGPIFFEFIQRKGDDGFGEGNFKALFEFDRGGPDPARRPEGRGGGIAFTARSLRGACNFRVSRRSCGAIVVT